MEAYRHLPERPSFGRTPAVRLRIYLQLLFLHVIQLVSTTDLSKGQCQTAGFRIQTIVKVTLQGTQVSAWKGDSFDCSQVCNDELDKFRDLVMFNHVTGTTMLRVPPSKTSSRAHLIYLDHCALHKRFCVQFWQAITMPLSLSAAADPGVESDRVSPERMKDRLAATAEPEKVNSAHGTTEEQSQHKIDCFCDALYVLPRIRRVVPTSYPVPGFKCDHNEICRRLTDLHLIRIGDVQWKCVDSAPLIEVEHCQPKGDTHPAACPCAHSCLSRTRIAGRPTRLTTCEDWKSNPKAIELLSKAPLTASQWKTFRLAESTNAGDTNTISSQTPGARARASTSQNPPLVHQPWLPTTGSKPRQTQPGLHPTESMFLDNMPRARLTQLREAPHTAAMHATPPISQLGETSKARTSDSSRQASLSSSEFPSSAGQAQEIQAYDPVMSSQLGSLWQNIAADQQAIRLRSRFGPFGQSSGNILHQETGNLDLIERQAALFEIDAQSFSNSLTKADERHSAEFDQTQTLPIFQSGAATMSGSKRKVDQMHAMPHLSSQSLMDVGSLSYAARFGIDVETIAAAAQCPATPAGEFQVVDPTSDMNSEVLPANHVGISSLGSLTDQMPESIDANDESAAADQAQEIDQTPNEPPDEWAWRFL